MNRHTSRITRLETGPGYGFIRTDNGTEVFFQASQVFGIPFGALEIGLRVSFTLVKARKGPRAMNVLVLAHDQAA